MSKSAKTLATVRSNIESLVQRHEPLGISVLLNKYKTEYNQPLDFKPLGYGKLSNFLKAIPSIKLNQNKGTDPTLSFIKDEKNLKNSNNEASFACIQKNIESLVQRRDPVSISHLVEKYKAEYSQPLDFKALGYGTITKFLEAIPSIQLTHHKGRKHKLTFIQTEQSPTETKSKSEACFTTVQKRLECLVQRSALISISSLPDMYKAQYNQPLDFEAFGYEKLTTFLEAIPSIQLSQLSDDDKKLSFVKAEHCLLESEANNDACTASSLATVRENIAQLLRKKGSINIQGITRIYENEYKQPLNYRAVGCGSLTKLLKSDPAIIVELSAKGDSYKIMLKEEGRNDPQTSEGYHNPDSKIKTDSSDFAKHLMPFESFMDRVKGKLEHNQDKDELKFSSHFIEKAYLVRQSDALQLKSAAVLANPSNDEKLEGETVYLNTNEPFCLATIGVPGAGKSHTLACILESCLTPTANIVRLRKPMTALVLHYDENTFSVCEAAGLLKPSVSSQYSTHVSQEKAIILVSPTFYKQRKEFYRDYCTVRPLLFKWQRLTADQIKRIMHIGPDDNQLYFATLLNLLRRYQKQAAVPSFQEFLEDVKQSCSCLGQRGPLDQRLMLLETLIAESDENQDIEDESLDLSAALTSGYKFIIADLTDPLLSRTDVNGLFEVLVEQFRTTPAQGGKVLALDEAHKYMNGTTSDNLSEAIVRVARLMRHDGIRLVVSTQSPKSLAPELLELVSVGVFHHFHSHDWWLYLKQKIPLPDNVFQTILLLKPGEAVTFASKSTFGKQVMQVRVRPRLTADFGESRKNN